MTFNFQLLTFFMSSFQKIFLSIIIGTLLSLASLIAIVVLIDPYSESALGKALFFVSFFLAFLGIFTIAGYFIRKWRTKRETLVHIQHSFRQGILFSLILTSLLILEMLSFFNWGTVLLVLGAGIAVEGVLTK